MSVLLFNKPYGVLSQFGGEPTEQTLAHYIKQKNIYPAGRLDKDSEGLLVLTDDGSLQHRISDPKHKLEKTYWAQVEHLIMAQALRTLSNGIELKDGLTLPAKVKHIEPPPTLWQRHPPIRERKNIPTCWIELKISEGRNRQVRRMTAAVGFPTLRLIRVGIGPWQLKALQPGEAVSVSAPRL